MAYVYQAFPGAELLRRQELALLAPLQRFPNGLRCRLYGHCSLLWAVRLHSDCVRHCSEPCKALCNADCDCLGMPFFARTYAAPGVQMLGGTTF